MKGFVHGNKTRSEFPDLYFFYNFHYVSSNEVVSIPLCPAHPGTPRQRKDKPDSVCDPEEHRVSKTKQKAIRKQRMGIFNKAPIWMTSNRVPCILEWRLYGGGRSCGQVGFIQKKRRKRDIPGPDDRRRN